MNKLTSTEQLDKLIQSKTIAMFTASWCPDCHFIAPHLDSIEASFPDYQFISIDRDEFIDTAVKYDVMGIPSFIAFDKGEEIGRFVSKERKTKEEIEAFINNL